MRWNRAGRCGNLRRLRPGKPTVFFPERFALVMVGLYVLGVVMGILAALILGVCGVSPEDIAADYSVSQIYLRPLYRWMRENIPDFAARKENAPFFSTAGENILAVCDHLENEYGGAERFLRECGAGADTLDALRRRMIKKA